MATKAEAIGSFRLTTYINNPIKKGFAMTEKTLTRADLSAAVYERDGDDLANRGLYLDVPEWHAHVFAVTPAEFHYNPAGHVHGGFAATVLDSAMGCAVYSTVDVGWTYTTIEIKVNYLKPITVQTGPLRGTGTLLHRGRRTAMAEGRLEDASGRLLAHATTTCLIWQV